MLNKIQSFQPDLDGTQLRIGVVMSRFNEAICLELRDACLDELVKLGVAAEDIVLATVPGALEIPHALGLMADSDEFDALIALGAIVRGETYHFELVANESGRGISLVASGYNLPVLNAVLTTENEEQAHARTEIIEIKATQSTSVGFRFSSDVAPPEFVLVLKINKDGHFSEIYNGKGVSIWEQLRHKKVPSNGQVQISLKKLKELNVLVANHDRIQCSGQLNSDTILGCFQPELAATRY